ncbi:hypothetical protein SUDANB15_00278 [Streptomyces sp. enrichment culture]|uniref:NACHT and WD repeat domain-containing protein n=1 Tax=Streptomyces sp. enrichment culture TaxID=1795815 RepID=UPI003F57F5D2
MGRREKPLDPDAGPVERFAVELRALRAAAGGPTYRVMAQRTRYSAVALSQAAAGEKLPSLAVTLAYVAACDGDTAEWEKRWHAVAQDMISVPRADDGEGPPYRGLARFEPGDSEVFFGREPLVDDLFTLLHAHRCTAVLGPSGSGKSSLLRAGLIPRLRQTDGPDLRPAALRILTPGQHPVRTHADKLEPAAGAGDTFVLVDQFEEVFTLCTDPVEREEFIRRLLTARDEDSRLRVVLGVRADFYGHCLRYPQLVAVLKDAAVPVGPMSPEELRQAIVKPAAARSMIVERALTARLVEETADEPGGLPLLSHALLETWRRRSGRTLTLKAYEAAGGVRGAIAQTAENAYASLPPERAELTRLILLRLITPGEGAQDTRRPVDRTELDFAPEQEIAAVVDRLVAARLLTVDDTTVDLAHEALITAWPRLGTWIDEARERLLVHRRLTDAARTWNDLGREPGALYRGTRLATADEHLADTALTPLERDFLTASRTARTVELRRRRGLLATLALLVVLALIAGLTAWQQSRTSNRRHVEAEARRIAAAADAVRSADPVTAMRLSVAAWHLAPTTESRSALLSATAQPEQHVFPVPDPVSGPALNRLTADGRTLLSVSARRVVTWDMHTRRRTGSYPGPGKLLSKMDVDQGFVPDWGVSPDGRLLALPAEKDVRLWDVRAGRVTATLPVADAVSTEFGTDGRHLTVVDADGEEYQKIQVWDLSGRQPLLSVRTPMAEERPIGVSADGRTLALCRDTHRLEIRDLRTTRVRTPHWAGRAGRVVCPDPDADTPKPIALSPDGEVLAAVTGGGIRRWAVDTGRELTRLNIEEAVALRFSADGTFLAAASGKEIMLWRRSEPNQPVFRYRLISEMITGFSLTPDAGAVRYLRGSGTSVTSLDLKPVTRTGWRKHALDRTRLARNGHTAAVVRRGPGRPGVELIDTRSGRTIITLPDSPCPPDTNRSASEETSDLQEEDPANCSELMAFTPDGRRFAYVRVWGSTPQRQRITVWDVATRRRVAALDAGPASAYEIAGLAFSADGRALLTSGSLSAWTLERWDLDTGRRTKMQLSTGGEILDVRSDDGVVVFSDNEAADLHTRRVRPLLLSDNVILSAGRFNRDGTRFAVGDVMGRVTVWDSDLRHRFGVFDGTYTGGRESEQEPVEALAFSPDGRILAVADASGSVRLWDVASGRRLGSRLPTSGQVVHDITFSDDGNTLYVSGPWAPAERIDLDTDRLVRRVCARVGSGLSQPDWRTYLPDVPYRRTC